jgi:hypothetical protein
MHTLREQLLFQIQYGAAPAFVLVALFPRAAHITRAPAFWGPKGIAAHTAYRAGWFFLQRYVWAPKMLAYAEREKLARAALIARLGREPDYEELIDDHRRRRTNRKATRRP